MNTPQIYELDFNFYVFVGSHLVTSFPLRTEAQAFINSVK